MRDQPDQKARPVVIRTPDHRLRVFVSSTLKELAEEREAVRQAILKLRLAPVMFESGARPHSAQRLYQAYLSQSHIFAGIYWQGQGWVAPGAQISGLEDEYNPGPGTAPLRPGGAIAECERSAAQSSRRSPHTRRSDRL